jgi:mRNA interferase HicA
MKRIQLLKHLKAHGCYQLREGSRHSWWINGEQSRRSAIPRHVEISDQLAKKICKDLGVAPVK